MVFVSAEGFVFVAPRVDGFEVVREYVMGQERGRAMRVVEYIWGVVMEG